jgi:hypothetical protein
MMIDNRNITMTDVKDLVQFTDDEILADTFDMSVEDYREIQGRHDSDLDPEDQLAAVEGSDGEPLGEDEIVASTVEPNNNSNPNNFDRTLELGREQAFRAQHEQDQHEKAQLQQVIARQHVQLDPERQAEQAQLNEDMDARIYSNVPGFRQAVVAREQEYQQQQQRDQHLEHLNNMRVKAVFEEAIENDPDFRAVMEGFEAVPLTAETIRARDSIMYHPDPVGQAKAVDAQMHGTPNRGAYGGFGDGGGSYRTMPRGPRPDTRDEEDQFVDTLNRWVDNDAGAVFEHATKR